MLTAIMSTSVPIAADDVVVRRGLRALFESEADITVVGEACDRLETIDLVTRLMPAGLVLDLMLPDVSGMSVLEQLSERQITTRLGLSRRTANRHRAAPLLRTLGLRGQQEIIRSALKRGLLEL